jgi:hypothetical protein
MTASCQQKKEKQQKTEKHKKSKLKNAHLGWKHEAFS